MTPQKAADFGAFLSDQPYALAVAGFDVATGTGCTDCREELAATRERPSRPVRIARAVRAHPLTVARNAVHAAKLLPTVRRALPWYVLPIIVVAALVKCLPLDFGADETLFTIAFALVLWKRPGLLEALYHEAAAGKPPRCQCGRHAKKAKRP